MSDVEVSTRIEGAPFEVYGRTVAALTQPQLDFSPRTGRWSIGEVLDHLLLVEAAYRSEIAQLVELQRSGRRRSGS